MPTVCLSSHMAKFFAVLATILSIVKFARRQNRNGLTTWQILTLQQFLSPATLFPQTGAASSVLLSLAPITLGH